jgi:hypothetical protein
MFVGCGFSSNVVLCIMTNGHISLETVQKGCCDLSNDSLNESFSKSPTLESNNYSGSCGPCVDVPAVKDVLGKRIASKTDKSLNDGFARSATALFSFIPQPSTEKYRISKQPQSIYPALQSLKTVIILS